MTDHIEREIIMGEQHGESRRAAKSRATRQQWEPKGAGTTSSDAERIGTGCGVAVGGVALLTVPTYVADPAPTADGVHSESSASPHPPTTAALKEQG